MIKITLYRQNEAPTNLLKRRLPSNFSKRGEKKFLSQQVFEFPASHQNIQPYLAEQTFFARKDTHQGTAFLQRKLGSFVSETNEESEPSLREICSRDCLFSFCSVALKTPFFFYLVSTGHLYSLVKR